MKNDVLIKTAVYDFKECSYHLTMLLRRLRSWNFCIFKMNAEEIEEYNKSVNWYIITFL